MNKEVSQANSFLMHSKECEKGLFEHIFTRTIRDSILICRDIYTVFEGVVYILNKEGFFQESGDTIFQLYNDTHRIGSLFNQQTCMPYHDIKPYSRVVGIDEFKKINNIGNKQTGWRTKIVS